jgi:hypothetical protein
LYTNFEYYRAGAAGTSLAIADGVLVGDAVEVAVAAGGPPTTLPADVCCWEPDLPADMVSGGGGASLEAEREEALTGKGRVKTCRHKSCTRKNQDGAKLTWGPGPSSDPGSATPAAAAVVAVAACNTQIIKLIKELISLCDLPSTF